MDPALIDKLPDSLKNVDITGGEPFLHSRLSAIIEKLARRKCNVIINTNGLVNLEKYSVLWKIKKMGIRFSLDAVGQKHDDLRGVVGCYEKVLKNIEYLKSIKLNNIGISSTFLDSNISYMTDLYAMSKRLGINFTCMVAGNSDVFYKKNDNIIKNPEAFKCNIGAVIKSELFGGAISGWRKLIYMTELIKFIDGEIDKICCPAGNKFFFMLPNGDIYACNMRNLLMGNLTKECFEDIWYSARAKEIRMLADNCSQPCWTMCNAKSVVSNAKLKYLGRFLKNINKIMAF